MAVLRNLNHLVGVVLDAFRNLGRGKAWLALLIYALILALVLVAHYEHLSPLFFGPVKAITSLIDSDLSDRFFHFPSHFLYLPWFYGWAKLAISVLLEGIFFGTAALAFWYAFTNTREERSSFKTALSLWPQFLLVSIIFNGLITGISFLVPQLMTEWLAGSPRRQLALELGLLPLIYTIILALFYLAIPAVAVNREPFFRAIGRSMKHAARRPFSMLTLAFLVLVFPLLVSAAGNHPDVIIDKFRPELVFWLLMIGLVVEMIANYFWMSTAVRFLIDEER